MVSVTKSCVGKNRTKQNKSVQVQDEPMVLMGQFINMASGSTLQLIFKELPLIGHLDGSIKCLALGFDSGHDLRAMKLSSTLGLLLSEESTWDSLPLLLPPPLLFPLLALSLSQVNI